MICINFFNITNITLIWFFVIVPIILLYTFLSIRKEYKLQAYFNNAYEVLTKFSLTRKKVSEVRLRLYKINLWDERLLRYKAASIYLQSMAIFIILVIFSIVLFNNNFFVMFTLIFFSYQIQNIILDWRIGDDTHLLKGLLDYLDDLMQEFSFNRNVLSSLQTAKEQNTNYTTVKHIERLIDAIDEEEKMNEYSVECHNQFLRLLAIASFLTNEHGDTVSANGKDSNYIENLKDIYTLIELELYKRRELRYWIKGLPFQCTVPLLIFVPYESWINSVFTMVQGFYQTASAFLLKIGITIICLICFSIIKSYEKTESEPILYKKATWEMVLLKIKPLAKIVKFLLPKENSKRSYRYRDLISKSGVLTKLEYIYLRILLFGIGASILTLLIVVSINHINYSNILKNNTTTFKNDIITASGKQVESTEIENEIIGALNSNDPTENKDTATQLLMQKGIVDKTTLKKVSQKIVDKKVALTGQRLKWWHFLLAIVIGLAATYIPEFFIRVRINARKLSMESELILFETIILILIAHDNCTTELILEYMSKFSLVFKEYIDVIDKKFEKLDYKAVEDILEEINYKQFSIIIRNIMKAEEIGVKEAFINLSRNRAVSLENRKREYEKLIDSRVAKSKLVSKIPGTLFILGYVIIPIIGMAFVQLVDIKNQMENM